jgi:hypothetical protein
MTTNTTNLINFVAENITEYNPQAHLELFEQKYNEESWAICRDSKGNPEPDPELRDTEYRPPARGYSAATAHGL